MRMHVNGAAHRLPSLRQRTLSRERLERTCTTPEREKMATMEHPSTMDPHETLR
jgi:hypothetical protein